MTKQDNSLMKLTEERINNNHQLVSFVEKAKAVTIPLFPETVQFTDTALKYGAALVSVDIKTDQYGSNRDIYKNESGGYCLHLSKLNEIAQQAGIQITDSRILERKTDERGRVTFISHQVKGRLKSVDGSIKEDVATGKYDYFRDAEKYTSEKQIKSRRSHAEALAESNAKTRLFNKLVAKLPTSFTLNELKKPFLIPYVIEDQNELLSQLPKEEQVKVKSELVRKRLGLIDTVYPASQKQVEEAVVTEVVADEQKTTSDPAPNETPEFIAETYREAPQNERTEKILQLIQLKNFQDPNGTPFTASRIEKNSLDNQIKFIKKLLEMPDAEEELPV